MFKNLHRYYQRVKCKLTAISGLAPLLLRLILSPVLIQAGWNKLNHFNDTVAWFGNSDWGLGLPLPWLLASLAIAAELLGGILLLLGLLTRLVSIPLMITMLVAIFAVHLPYGWPAIADTSSWLADGTILLNERVMDSSDKIDAARSLLQQHGNYDWLTASGKLVILNNGIEFAAMYFAMLLSLLFTGGGRYVSIDYWLTRSTERSAPEVLQ
ncbi:HvfX family Cu-binding RiPP maturation protein [Arsukibacterium indicum]|uniref:DoxX family protein n=1 Tax=Arsukibacterium indicum TaxID=2848612 RepID=A0ABS6ML68_9GAMM|nr:DoxX family protein [Arsukibacterium indicum]MBV2129567.1 DoxX family protein [Arsukibacterium indicum]